MPSADPRFALGFARIVTHFWRHGSWLAEEEVIRSVSRLAVVPAKLRHGVLDLRNLLGTPWQLAAAWPGSELGMVDAGHRAAGQLAEAVVDATDAFRE